MKCPSEGPFSVVFTSLSNWVLFRGNSSSGDYIYFCKSSEFPVLVTLLCFVIDQSAYWSATSVLLLVG